MQRQKHRSNQPPGGDAGSEHSFDRSISGEEKRRRKELAERLVGKARNPGSKKSTRFLKVTTSNEMGEFIEHIFGLMEEEDRNETIGRLLNDITSHISEATPQAVMTALRSTFHYRDQYKSSWLGLLESARKNFGNRTDVDVDSLLTGLHA